MLINYSTKELDLCARIMRAEALAEGDLGMLMVGNVVVNRAIADCLDFTNVRTITDVIYQKNQFSGTKSSLFQSSSTTKEKELAKRVLKGEYYHPATNFQHIRSIFRTYKSNYKYHDIHQYCNNCQYSLSSCNHYK